MSGWDHVSDGDPWRPPRAEVQNAILDVAKASRGRMRSSVPDEFTQDWRTRLWLKNSSGNEITRGDVIAVRDLLSEPRSDQQAPFERPILVGTTPIWPDDAGRLAVTLGKIKDGKIGQVAVSGLAIVKCEVLSTSHRWIWFSDDAPNWLKTGDAGQAKIVGNVPAVGTGKYLLVDLDREQPLWRFVTEDGTSSVAWKLADYSGNVTTQEFTLHDPFSIFERIDEAGWQGYVQWVDDKILPAGAPCEKPDAVWNDNTTWNDGNAWSA